MATEFHIDALLPPEMARKAEQIGVRKASLPTLTTFLLAILAGAFIALGAVFATIVSAGASGLLSYGVTRLLAGIVFSLGLILVVVGGAELFTGNNLIVMAWAGRKISFTALLRNWTIVYFGNLVGAVATAAMVFLSSHYTFGGGVIGQTALSIAAAKTALPFVPAFFLGVLCNGLVCLAVWLTFSARSTTDKVMAIIFPIAAFVAAGFEHSVANMYFIPMGLFIKQFDPAFVQTLLTNGATLNLTTLTWGNFLANLLPVTLGNIVGGGVLVAGFYWAVYLRQQ